jgi:hypothetical protein
MYKGNMAIRVKSPSERGNASKNTELYDPHRPIDSPDKDSMTREHPFREGFLRVQHEGSYLITEFSDEENNVDLPTRTSPRAVHGFDGSDFWGFPRRKGWDIPVDRDDLAVEAYVQPLRSKSPQSAATFLQAWLYFGLLFTVLDRELDLEDLITINLSNKPVITLQGFIATKTLLRWSVLYRTLPAPIKQKQLQKLTEYLDMARLYVGLEEDGHLDFIPFIHELALSIRILGCTLQYFVNLTFGVSMLQLSPPKSTRPGAWEVFMPTKKEQEREAWLALPEVTWGMGKAIRDRLAHPPYSRLLDLPLKFIVSDENAFAIPGLVKGRCRNEIARLSTVLPAAALYFMSSLRKQRSYLEHESHGDCDDTTCRANNINQQEYRTIHHLLCTRERRSNCTFIGPCSTDTGKRRFEEILQRGKIPLLRIMNYDHGGFLAETSGDAYFDVVEYDGTEPFCAISHVWSDGLGNAGDNTLPTCQIPAVIRRLAQSRRPVQFHKEEDSLISSSRGSFMPEPQDVNYGAYHAGTQGAHWHWRYLGDPKTAYGLFWMDTLCIPASGSLKKVMIRQMRKVYQSAACVLVIDNSLERISASNIHYSECFARILESAWMRRLWTFQEAVLAQKLLIMFQEGPVDIDNLIAGVEDQASRLRHISLTSLQLAQGVRAMLRLSSTKHTGTIWNQGVFRTATKVGDESLCLAGMLDIDTERLFELDDVGRARYFYSQLSSIPQSMLFTDHAKLKDVGYRWADSSLLRSYLKPSRDGQIITINDGNSNSSRLALRVQQPGFIVWSSYAHLRFKRTAIILCADRDGSERLLKLQLHGKFATFEIPETGNVGVLLEKVKYTRYGKLSNTKAVIMILRANHTQFPSSLLGTIECFGTITEIEEEELTQLELFGTDFFLGTTGFEKSMHAPTQWLVQ